MTVLCVEVEVMATTSAGTNDVPGALCAGKLFTADVSMVGVLMAVLDRTVYDGVRDIGTSPNVNAYI